MKKIILLLIYINISITSYALQYTKLNIDLTERFTYNNNILSLSKSDISKLRNGEGKDKFHIETTDDLIINSRLSADCYLKFKKQRYSKLFANVNFEHLLKNSIKDTRDFSLGIFSRYDFIYGELRYTFSPDNYVAHYKDADLNPPIYKPYTYEKEIYGSYLGFIPLADWKLEFHYSYQNFYYNKYFTEYDAKRNVYGGFIKKEFRNVSVKLGYFYTDHNCRGYGRDEQSYSSSDKSDYSFLEDTYKIKLYMKNIKVANRRFDFDFLNFISYRAYTSDKGAHIDPFHYGVEEYRLWIKFQINTELSKRIDIAVGDIINIRDKSSDFIDISKYKDYHLNQVYFELRYKLLRKRF